MSFTDNLPLFHYNKYPISIFSLLSTLHLGIKSSFETNVSQEYSKLITFTYCKFDLVKRC